MSFIVDGTLGGTFPSWTTATRPSSPVNGQMGYNSTTGAFDAYVNGAWTSVATSATAPVNGPAFYAYLTADQSITSNSATKVTLDSELFDTNSNFASSRFTPTVAGYYQINAGFSAAGTALTLSTIYIRKNGSTYAFGQSYPNTTYSSTINISTLISLNGSTDYVELFGLIIGTSPIFGSGAANTFMNGCLVRSA